MSKALPRSVWLLNQLLLYPARSSYSPFTSLWSDCRLRVNSFLLFFCLLFVLVWLLLLLLMLGIGVGVVVVAVGVLVVAAAD